MDQRHVARLAGGKEGAEPADLPASAYALLGLLTFGEKSGYDLGKFVNETIAHFFFNPAKSQVYSELRRLVTRGYATERKVVQHDRPDKRLYAVTAAGRAALRQWLETSPVTPELTRGPVYLKVFFGALMDPGSLRAQVEGWREQVEEELAQFVEIEHDIEGDPGLFFPGLVLRRGIAHKRQSIRWAGEVMEQLDRRQAGGDREAPPEPTDEAVRGR
jgi:DNA-binding PadR family transcriptional regulator